MLWGFDSGAALVAGAFVLGLLGLSGWAIVKTWPGGYWWAGPRPYVYCACLLLAILFLAGTVFGTVAVLGEPESGWELGFYLLLTAGSVALGGWGRRWAFYKLAPP